MSRKAVNGICTIYNWVELYLMQQNKTFIFRRLCVSIPPSDQLKMGDKTAETMRVRTLDSNLLLLPRFDKIQDSNIEKRSQEPIAELQQIRCNQTKVSRSTKQRTKDP